MKNEKDFEAFASGFCFGLIFLAITFWTIEAII